MVHFKHCIILLCISFYIAKSSEAEIAKSIAQHDEIKTNRDVVNESEKPLQIPRVNNSSEKSQSMKTQIEGDDSQKGNPLKGKTAQASKESPLKEKDKAESRAPENLKQPSPAAVVKTSELEKGEPAAPKEVKFPEAEKTKPASSEGVKSPEAEKAKPPLSKDVKPDGAENQKSSKENESQNQNPVEEKKNSESAVLPEETEEIKKRLDIDIEESAQTGFYLLMGISASALVFVTFKIFSLRQSRARRRYGVRGNTTQELAPLPTSMESAESDEDDQTIFDRNRQQMRIF